MFCLLGKTKGILHNIEDLEHKEENKVFPTFKKILGE
jgi:hypothetical protein